MKNEPSPISGKKKDEAVTEQLRELFRLRGFTQVRVNEFEEYELYVENKNFLESGGIITFMDLGGNLMALKPDVTLSIAKSSSSKEIKYCEKLFYADQVCRLSRETGEYKMLGQVGVELIGPPDPFVNLETLDLALESLSLISGDFVLDVSHLGFVSGLLETAEPGGPGREKLIAALHSKSPHQLADLLNNTGLSAEEKERFYGLAALSGNICSALPRAKEFIVSDQMEDAWNELYMLGEMLRECGMAQRVNLDFSVVNDLDYYNGLIFNGYVRGVPGAVLTGGRYDSLMRRMGKKSGAIGFAVFLSELNTYFKGGKTHDFDILLTYDDDADYASLLGEARAFTEAGKSVRLARAGKVPPCVCLERFHFEPEGLVSVEEGGINHG